MFSLNVASSCRTTTSGFWLTMSCACAAGVPPTSVPPKLIFHVITLSVPPPEVGVGLGAGAGVTVVDPVVNSTADRFPTAPVPPLLSKTIRIVWTPAERDTYAFKSWYVCQPPVLGTRIGPVL